MIEVDDDFQKQIEEYKGILLVGDEPETFPFDAHEIFRNVANKKMLRFTPPNNKGLPIEFCWKNVAEDGFEICGYVASYHGIKEDMVNIEDNIKGIEIKVYEYSVSKNVKRIASSLQVRLNMYADVIVSGEIIFQFHNHKSSWYELCYDAVTHNKTRCNISIYRSKSKEKKNKCLCFREKKKRGPEWGIKDVVLPTHFIVDDNLKILETRSSK